MIECWICEGFLQNDMHRVYESLLPRLYVQYNAQLNLHCHQLRSVTVYCNLVIFHVENILYVLFCTGLILYISPYTEIF